MDRYYAGGNFLLSLPQSNSGDKSYQKPHVRELSIDGAHP